ncbi:DUF4097 family beta strand repeat protein [Flexivirga sp. ID2601S]|uniref:DUF4097 family beta strand repeat protein n=1 Tax=Flexivirga aerilata TaxID=1656889 RepID=A0A849AJ51_9MICO|nr:DUF4097 family beta strand repeat-containing protein [Flexivirga aerilata]NNG39278.1 DUF4097 family beta strand repeat protein [Flexivirga aerilata]
MTEKWQISEPRTLDVGGEGERVRALTIGLVGGHVDVVTHDDSPTARVEIHEVVGPPLEVSWDGSTVKVAHVKAEGQSLWETLKSLGGGVTQKARARVSVSIPQDARASVSTVSADAVVSGIHAATKLNTVSGDITADDLVGDIDVNGVSGVFEGHDLRGTLKVNTVSGSMTVHRSALDPVKLNGVSGDITLDLTQARTNIDSNSVSGDVTVRLPAGGGYRVRVSTMSGAAIVDGVALGGKPGKRGGEASEGDESLRLKASSVSGDVVVLRSAATAGPELAKDGSA